LLAFGLKNPSLRSGYHAFKSESPPQKLFFHIFSLSRFIPVAVITVSFPWKFLMVSFPRCHSRGSSSWCHSRGVIPVKTGIQDQRERLPSENFCWRSALKILPFGQDTMLLSPKAPRKNCFFISFRVPVSFQRNHFSVSFPRSLSPRKRGTGIQDQQNPHYNKIYHGVKKCNLVLKMLV
jgi:hypothetical protein